MKAIIRTILYLALAGCVAAPALAQGDTPARIKTRTELVVVPVTVKDSRGNLVSDVTRDEFRIFQDGVEQEISLFSVDPFPLSAVIVLDNDLGDKASKEVQKSLDSIAAAFGPNDEVALITFDEYPQTVMDFTRSNDQLFAQLKRTRLENNSPPPGGGPWVTPPVTNTSQVGVMTTPTQRSAPPKVTKCLNDAIYAATDLLRTRGRDRRKIIFLVSDGNNAKTNKWTYDATLTHLLEADVSVYAIGIGHVLLLHEGGLLPRYANTTGGDFFFASKQPELERLYASICEEARNRYTLAYVPHTQAAGRNYHSIEVRVRRPGLDLSARQGFYSGPAQ
ncbi:MAG: VWA domain-containing protein [Candidatus Acidiferrales bacterium]